MTKMPMRMLPQQGSPAGYPAAFRPCHARPDHEGTTVGRDGHRGCRCRRSSSGGGTHLARIKHILCFVAFSVVALRFCRCLFLTKPKQIDRLQASKMMRRAAPNLCTYAHHPTRHPPGAWCSPSSHPAIQHPAMPASSSTTNRIWPRTDGRAGVQAVGVGAGEAAGHRNERCQRARGRGAVIQAILMPKRLLALHVVRPQMPRFRLWKM